MMCGSLCARISCSPDVQSLALSILVGSDQFPPSCYSPPCRSPSRLVMKDEFQVAAGVSDMDMEIEVSGPACGSLGASEHHIRGAWCYSWIRKL